MTAIMGAAISDAGGGAEIASMAQFAAVLNQSGARRSLSTRMKSALAKELAPASCV
jgi:hypothetical protein